MRGIGGGRHRQQVGLEPLGQQAIALAHAKAMLFIHHYQPQAVELHRVFQQGMGTHQQLQLAIGQVLQQGPAPGGGG